MCHERIPTGMGTFNGVGGCRGSSTYSDVNELVTHAQQSQVQSKRIDHMGFRKALIDVLKLDIKEPAASNVQAEDDTVVWPPIVVVENTRTGMGADKRWEGVTNSEMAVLLNGLKHPAFSSPLLLLDHGLISLIIECCTTSHMWISTIV